MRSAEIQRIKALPPVDPETGAPKPFILTGQADDDVAFLLEMLDEAQNEVAQLEEALANFEDVPDVGELTDEPEGLDRD
jgi:hypothetical protein